MNVANPLTGNMITIKIADCLIGLDDSTYEGFPGLREYRTETMRRPDVVLPRWTENTSMKKRTFVYQLLCKEILQKEVIPFHGSAIKINGHAHIFIGPSGAGKSTHAKMWEKAFPDSVEIINDDRPFLRFEKSIIVYGSPWMGKHEIGRNTKAELKSICVIKQGKINSINRLSETRAFPLILRQCFPYNDPHSVESVVKMAKKLVETVPIWELVCLKDVSAAKLACRVMEGDYVSNE